jgi:hypothetical protein
MQYMHGIVLPPLLVVPKIFTAAIASTNKKIVGVGCTIGRSFTVHFEDGSWLKTLLYADAWPDANSLVNHPSYPVPVPEGMFEGMLTVAEFSDGDIYTFDGVVQSHESAEVGAQYEVPGLQGGKHFSEESIKKIAPFATQIDLTTYPQKAFFFGENMRGVIMCVVGSKPNVEG